MINLSENLEDQIESFKKILEAKYRENGGKKNLEGFTLSMIQNEIDNLDKINALKKEIEGLKQNNTVPKDFKFTAVNAGRENAELAKLAAMGIRGTLDYIEPPWDEKSIFDERFKRDNAVLKLAPPEEADAVVILRDEDGRMA